MNLAESWQSVGESILPAARPENVPSAAASDEAPHRFNHWRVLFSNRPRPLLVPQHNRGAQSSSLQFFLQDTWRLRYARARLRIDDFLNARVKLPIVSLPLSANESVSHRDADQAHRNLAYQLAEDLAPSFTINADPTSEPGNGGSIFNAPELAFQIGTPGPYQKASMLIMSAHGNPLSLVKIALGKDACAMVAAEAAWLRRLNEHATLREFIPQLLKEGKTRSNRNYIALSVLPGESSASIFTTAHADFLRRLGSIDCQRHEFQQSSACRYLFDNLRRLAPSLTPQRHLLLVAALEDCMRILAPWEGPLVVSHGDFAPWNIRTHNRAIYVFDWEYAHAGSLPLFDHLHFHLIQLAASNRALSSSDLLQALESANRFAHETYASYRWDRAVVAAQALAYLLHVVLFYGLSRGRLLESHSVISAYLQLLEKRSQWLP